MIPFAIFVALVFFLSLISHRIERTILTPPMIFTAAGILLFVFSAGKALAQSDLKLMLIAGELALALVLFTDATRIRIRNLASEAPLPTRLLGIGMPLTIAGGSLLAWLAFPEFTIWEAAVLATILAPTDAGLGHAVVNSKRVSQRIRQALNIESGLNDGLSLPLLMLFIALAQITEHPLERSWIVFALEQIGLGLGAGMGVGLIGGWLTGQATRRGWMARSFEQIPLLALAMLSWGSAELIGGNGFIAAFVAGLAVKLGVEDAGEAMVDFSEAWGELLNNGVFFLFGIVAAPLLPQIEVVVAVVAILSLTAVRMIPVALAMIRTRLRASTVLFMGWFGPRGLASIVLGLIFLEESADLPAEPMISLVVVATVLFSVFAHGLSATPGIRFYARQIADLPDEAPERQGPL